MTRARDVERVASGANAVRRAAQRVVVVETLSSLLGPVHGTVPGQCMCCMRMEPRKLTIDHDHDCCPAGRSWNKRHLDCVRGLICPDCNAIEGKIRQIYGPPFPKLIQEYLDRADAFRRSRVAASEVPA